MKKHYLLSTLMLLVLAVMLPQNVKAQVSVWDGTYAPWTHGTGTESDPFLIENAQQLAYLAYRVNNGLDAAGGHVSNNNLHYKLMTDVNLNGSQSFQWAPIGYWNSNTDYYCFGGHFDGNSHIVSGLYINSSANRVGFFGYTDGAEIKNLSVSGNTVATSGQYAGGIVGCAISSTISYSSNNANISVNTNVQYPYCGGLIGNTIGSAIIKGCHNYGTISASKQSSGGVVLHICIGGIVGASTVSYSNNNQVTIINCANHGNITASGYAEPTVGGIIGTNVSQITLHMNNCYNSANIQTTTTTGTSNVGGIVGALANASSEISRLYNTGNIVIQQSSYQNGGGIVGYIGAQGTFINDCYNVGSIQASQYSGGIIARNQYTGYGTVSNCYYRDNCGGTNTYGGSPMSSAAMQTSDFVNILNNGSCAFEQDLSPFSNSGYPTLTMIIHEIATLDANNITQSHAGLKGTISVENDEILSAGFMYKASTTNNFSFVTISNANDTINCTLSGLSPSTSYSYKTFIFTTGCDTTFGETKNFTTSSISITTNNASNITQTHSTLNGTFSIGDAAIAAQGFEYKKSTDTDYQTINVSGSGNLEHTIANLIPGTQYTYKAFCTAVGCSTIYGTSKTFTTVSVSVYTNSANVTQSQSTLHGSLSMGDATVTSQGFEYKQIGGDWVQVTVPYGDNISYTLTNLIPNTQYSYRVFATANECGTIYGQIRSFTTSSVSATTNNATNVTQTHATLNGSFTIGDASISAQGFEYKKTADTAYQIVNVSGEGSITETITGLTPNTQYVYRSFCTAIGCETVYGATKYFTTSSVSVTTNPATSLTESSATLNGSMNMGDATVTNKGFEYRAVGDNTYTTINATSGTDIFSASLYGLPVNTDYEYRAFVNIAESTEPYYGDIQTFEVSWLNADTILIYDADMLRWVSDRCNTGDSFEGKYIKLMNNIVLPLNQPNNMTSIGVYPNHPFKGTFDGNGMTITNLYIDQPNTPYQGFFGYTQNANLYQVGLVNITASGRNYTGGMVAYAENTYMRDCYVNGGSLFALSYCGGLVGYQSEGTNSIISGCYNTCTVSGTSYVGGLVGFSNYATVRNSYVAASVAAQGTAVGAIIGGANEVLMYNCYFSTSITGQSNAIGEHNFRDGEGLSNEEMQSTQFVATLNQGLVTPVWKSDYAVPINNGFPILIWQYSDAEACEAPDNLNHTINGNSATLTWHGGDNASYFTVEYGMNGGDVHTENTSNHQLVIHNLQNSNYFWRVKSVCSFGESNFVNGSTIVTGISNHDLNASLNVYPNPTTDMVNVQLTMNNVQSNNVEIQLYDVFGKLLDVVETQCTTSLQQVVSPIQAASPSASHVTNAYGVSLQTRIDLSHYTNGVYFIKAVSEGNVLTVRKVVKNR